MGGTERVCIRPKVAFLFWEFDPVHELLSMHFLEEPLMPLCRGCSSDQAPIAVVLDDVIDAPKDRFQLQFVCGAKFSGCNVSTGAAMRLTGSILGFAMSATSTALLNQSEHLACDRPC